MTNKVQRERTDAEVALFMFVVLLFCIGGAYITTYVVPSHTSNVCTSVKESQITNTPLQQLN